jgi:hypothetical protein
MARKAKVRRALKFEGTGVEIELAKVTEIDVPKRFLYIEERKDGSFMLSVSKSLLPDIAQLEAIKMIRSPIVADEVKENG